MHRFLDWTTDIVSPAGWVPLGDLLGWLLSAVYLPLLVGSGVAVAIIDSSGSMLSTGLLLRWHRYRCCQYFTVEYYFILYELYKRIVGSHIKFICARYCITANNRQLLELNLTNTFSFPIGY